MLEMQDVMKKMQYNERHINILVAVIIMTQITSVLAEIIPSTRRVDWMKYPPGVKGGIPTNRVVFCNVATNAPGGTNAIGDANMDCYSVIQDAINRCPSNQVVFIPGGTFLFTRAFSLKSGITLRGAGPDKTVLIMTNWPAASPSGKLISTALNTTDTINGAPTNSNDILSGATQYATNLTLASTKGLVAGGFALIDQANDPRWVGYHEESDFSYIGRLSGTRVAGTIVEILSVGSSNVTFTPPLAWWYTNNAQITPIKTTFCYGGLENLCIPCTLR